MPHAPSAARSIAVALLTICICAPVEAAHVKVADLQYGDFTDDLGASVPLLLDLYLPTDVAPPFPTIVWLHGGGWLTGSKDGSKGEFLADAGYAVASIDYRLSPVAPWPAQIHDCKGAVRWLRAHAATHQLDPDRIGAWGPSAGGHLAACLGTMGGVSKVRIGGLTIDLEGTVGGNLERSSRVAAVVDWFGPTDFLSMDQFPGSQSHDAPLSFESQLLGGPIQGLPELARSADPIRFLSHDDPPALVVHGTADPIVPYSQSSALCRRACDGFGLAYTLDTIDNGAHGDAGFEPEQARAWFDSHLLNLPPVRVRIGVDSGPLQEGAQAGATAIRLERSAPAIGDLRVRVGVGGTAMEAIDLAAIGGSFVIPAGALTLTVPLVALDDALVEGTERIEIALAQTLDYRIDASADVAIIDLLDDEDASLRPSVTMSCIVEETSEGSAAPGVIRFSRSGDISAALSVHYRMSGDVLNGTDVTLLDGQVDFAADADTTDVAITALLDGHVEPTELSILELLPGPDYSIGEDRSAAVRLSDADRDPALPLVNLVQTGASIVEGAIASAFQLTRVGPTAAPLVVHLAVSGTATAGLDYPAFDPAITLPADTSLLLLYGITTQDTLLEGRETLEFGILPDPAYQIGSAGRDAIAIEDDEVMVGAPPAVSLETTAIVAEDVYVFTLDGVPSDASFVLFVGLQDAFTVVPGASTPLLLDIASAFPVVSGSAPGGRVAIGFALPDVAAAADVTVLAQAIVFGGGSTEIGISNLVRRRILTR